MIFAHLSYQPPIVLTYHDVIERRRSDSLWFDCSANELSQQLDWLVRKGAQFATLDQLRDHISGRRRLASRSVVVTFADNYEGFYLRAWPILKRRKIPVAMFVHTGFVGNRNGRPKMAWDQLKELDRSGLVTVASQTVSHDPDIRKLTIQKLRLEFTASKASLANHLGHEISYLAFPNGKCDVNVANEAKAAGYALAFSEVTQPVRQGVNPWLVPRYVHTKYQKAWNDAERAKN